MCSRPPSTTPAAYAELARHLRRGHAGDRSKAEHRGAQGGRAILSGAPRLGAACKINIQRQRLAEAVARRQHGFPGRAVSARRTAAAELGAPQAIDALGGALLHQVLQRRLRRARAVRAKRRATSRRRPPSAWSALGENAGRRRADALKLEAEISIMVARSPSGQVAIYPPALNHHARSAVLAWSALARGQRSRAADRAARRGDRWRDLGGAACASSEVPARGRAVS